MSFVLDDQAKNALFLEAQSANTYTDYEVSDAELAEVWDLIKWGPTAVNNQPLRIFTVRAGAQRDALVDAAVATNKEKVSKAPLNVIVAADTNFHQYLAEQHPYGANFVPAFEGDAEMRRATATANAWLQAGYLIVGLRARGFAVGPMVGFDFDKIKAELLPGDHYEPLMVMGVGKPGEDAYYPRSPRLDASTVILPSAK